MNAPSQAWVQFSSGQGPLECERAVSRLVPVFMKEARAAGLRVEELDRVSGNAPDCLWSVLLGVGGEGVSAFLTGWRGTVQWRAPSPFRPAHKRKNWFVGVETFEAPDETSWDCRDVVVEAFRGSGPGGQNVNKVSTAVRVTHRPTGLVVVAREERTQGANRSLALARLQGLLQNQADQTAAAEKETRRLSHYRLERGNPVRTIHQPLD